MDHIEFLERISEGAYGEVFKARDKSSGRIYAVKRMKAICYKGSDDYELALREIGLLKKLKHVSVVELVSACITPSGRIYLVFEYCPNTLLGLLREREEALARAELRIDSQPLPQPKGSSLLMGRGLPRNQVQSIMYQLCLGIAFMHKQGVMHRDLKPANVLLSEQGVVKICDFGFSRNQRSNESKDNCIPYTTYVVTRWYRPPEIVVGDSYSISVDIWALGCILIDLLTGTALFPGKSNHDQLYLIMEGIGTRLPERFINIIKHNKQFASFKPPTSAECHSPEIRFRGYHFSPETWELFKACLDPEPLCRKTAEEILALKYFDGVEDHLPEEVRNLLQAERKKKEAYETARAAVIAAHDHQLAEVVGSGHDLSQSRHNPTSLLPPLALNPSLSTSQGKHNSPCNTTAPAVQQPLQYSSPCSITSSRSNTQPQVAIPSDQPASIDPEVDEIGGRRRGASFDIARVSETFGRSNPATLRRRSVLVLGEVPESFYSKAAEATSHLAAADGKPRRNSALIPSLPLSRQTSESSNSVPSSGEHAHSAFHHLDDTEGRAPRAKSLSHSKSRHDSRRGSAVGDHSFSSESNVILPPLPPDQHHQDHHHPLVKRHGSNAPVIGNLKSLFH